MLPIRPIAAHFVFYFRHALKIFLARIGLIQNAKFFALETHGAEAVFAIKTEFAVFAIRTRTNEIGEVAAVGS